MKASAKTGDSKSGGGKVGGGGNSSIPGSKFKPTSEIELGRMDLPTDSSGNGLNLASDTKTGSSSSPMGLAALVIGANSLALGCKVTELFVLLNYYDEEGQQEENVSLLTRLSFSDDQWSNADIHYSLPGASWILSQH